ncbi:TPA: hypothetical protein ACUNC8_005407, partial [Escherichia coli]
SEHFYVFGQLFLASNGAGSVVCGGSNSLSFITIFIISNIQMSLAHFDSHFVVVIMSFLFLKPHYLCCSFPSINEPTTSNACPP